jgi:hypothetical protein
METKTTHLDKEGNCFVVKTGKRGAITIYLRLANENNLRELGIVNAKNRTFKITRDPQKHLFLKNHSYGFNEYVIRTAKKFDNIHLVETTGNEYIFPRQLVMDRGDYLHFKTEGYERQLFLQLSELTEYKVNPSI